jgi:hypothetical protein
VNCWVEDEADTSETDPRPAVTTVLQHRHEGQSDLIVLAVEGKETITADFMSEKP